MEPASVMLIATMRVTAAWTLISPALRMVIDITKHFQYNFVIIIITYTHTIYTHSLLIDSLCSQGDIRLAGGTQEHSGRVEICLENKWQTVCDDEWDSEDAMVTCRQIGHETYGKNNFNCNTLVIAHSLS